MKEITQTTVTNQEFHQEDARLADTSCPKTTQTPATPTTPTISKTPAPETATATNTTTSTSTAAALTTETTITTTTTTTNAVAFDTYAAELPYLEPWQLSASERTC